MNEAVVLQARNLTKVFDEGVQKVTLFEDLNFTVNAGERIAIIGRSGVGKSTLLHLLGGLDHPTQGDIVVAGRALGTFTEAQRSRWRNQHLGFIYQFHHLLPEFTALENAAMPLLLRGVRPALARETATALLEEVALADRLHHKPSELSGGERQRVAVVRALIGEPRCVLADEPTGNLDGVTAQRVFDALLALNRSRNTSLIIVTHDPQLAQKLDRVWQLRDGRLET